MQPDIYGRRERQVGLSVLLVIIKNVAYTIICMELTISNHNKDLLIFYIGKCLILV